MLTGRNPWRIASAAEDEGYAQFLKDGPRFLPCILPISAEAAQILALIFDPRPRTRITIPQLRCVILKARTFFPASPSIPDYIRLADMSFKASLQEQPQCQMDSSARVTFENPTPNASLIPLVPTPGVEASESTFVNDGRSSATSSDTESPGPATPETHASDPITIISPLSLAAGNGVVEAIDVRIPQPVKVHTKLPRKVQRFVGVIHRIF